MSDTRHCVRSGTLEERKEMLDNRMTAAAQHEPVTAHVRTSSSLAERKNMFAEKAAQHQKQMDSNPFSENFKKNKPVPLKKGDPNYGKPVAGSKSEMRALQAAARINIEVAALCDIIHQEGERYEDGTAAITFGELFQIYTHISNKLVGILLRARKHRLLTFQGEVLFQGRDEREPIVLLKSIKTIKAELAQDTEFEVGICHKSKTEQTNEVT